MSSDRSFSLEVAFIDSDFTGVFADGSNGLWEASDLTYTNANGDISSLNGNYYGAEGNWGISASFSGDSVWTVTGDSYLGSLVIEDEASIVGLDGYSLEMTVNGTVTDIAAGTYSGEIIISIVSE